MSTEQLTIQNVTFIFNDFDPDRYNEISAILNDIATQGHPEGSKLFSAATI